MQNYPGTAAAGFLLAALSCSWAAHAAAGPREVLIYYANETAPDAQEQQNYDTIIGWLAESDLPKANKIARTLNDEQVSFPAAVDAEIAAMRAGAADTNAELPLAVFTNRSARAGRFWLLTPGARRFEEVPFPPASNKDYILASNALAQGDTLRRALAAVSRRYPPAKHRYVLITKSHGSSNMALTVRLTRKHEELTREALLAMVADDESPSRPPQLGINKHEYFDILAGAGREPGMEFSLVFMESCRGVIKPDLQQQLPPNVARLYTSGDRALNYTTLDYQALLSQVNDQRPLSMVLDEFMAPRYLALSREQRKPLAGWIWLTFAPLALLLLGGLVWLLRRGKGRD